MTHAIVIVHETYYDSNVHCSIVLDKTLMLPVDANILSRAPYGFRIFNILFKHGSRRMYKRKKICNTYIWDEELCNTYCTTRRT